MCEEQFVFNAVNVIQSCLAPQTEAALQFQQGLSTVLDNPLGAGIVAFTLLRGLQPYVLYSNPSLLKFVQEANVPELIRRNFFPVVAGVIVALIKNIAI